jgi:hypothetical protein
MIQILPLEHIGQAKTVDGILNIGGLEIPYEESIDGTVNVYIRRESNGLSIMEISIAAHDGLAAECMENELMEADRYPGGPKEYYRGSMVGKNTYGIDGHPMTDAEFELEWSENDDDDDGDDEGVRA